MNNYGFFIKKLQLEGNSVKTVSIQFDKGLNVIYGSSDTGKTFIYECIDYMLGSTKTPKNILESRDFTLSKLEIESFNGDKFILERALRGGDLKLYDKNNQFIKDLNSKNDKNSDEKTISDFLLELCNIKSKEIRKNANGVKQNLYFQDIIKYFLIDETKILTAKSPISVKPDRSGNIAETFEKNVFKFLLTGEDDSSIITLLKKDAIDNKKGKIEVYDELIEKLKIDLKNIDYNDIDKQIERLDKSIKNFRQDYATSNLELKKHDKEKQNLYLKIQLNKSNLINSHEIIKRSNILKDQYLSDISRLKATIEIGHGLNLVDTSNCPICTSEVKEKVNIDELINATKIEINKIELLLTELENTQVIFLSEKEQIESDNTNDNDQYKIIIEKIQNELKEILEEISLKIKEFTYKKGELSKIKALKDNLDNYTKQKKKIEQIISDNKDSKKDTNYEELTSSLFNPIITQIKSILKEMNFENIDNTNIGFSEEFLDFSIGAKNRKEFGKGYRAVLYAVFIISLLKYFRTKPYQIGFTLIDSPLNPYKADDPKDEKDKLELPNNLANQFYKYLYNNIKEEQVILIENTQVPDELIDDINHITFDKSNGFLPNVNLKTSNND